MNGLANIDLGRASATVNALTQAILHGAPRLDSVPGLLKQVIREELWHARQLPRSSIVEHYETFVDFIVDGLGTTVAQLHDLCRRDTEALDLLDKVTQNPHGGDHKSKAFNVDNINVDIVNIGDVDNIHIRKPDGTSVAANLRRLRKDRPEIHAKVIAGELSSHAGMIQAGLRRRKAQIDLEPELAARQLRRHFPEAQDRARISELLTDG